MQYEQRRATRQFASEGRRSDWQHRKALHIMSFNRRGSETTNSHAFQHSLRLLDRSTSWFMWSSILMILLPPGAIILLSLPWPLASFVPFQAAEASLLVRGLLALMWVMSVFT